MLPLIILVTTLAFSLGEVTNPGEQTGNKTEVKQCSASEFEKLKLQLDGLQSTLSKLITFTEKAEQARKESHRLMMERLQTEIAEKIARLHTKRNITDCREVEITGKYFLQNRDNSSVFPVVCEADAFDGGWLVIQQRVHGGLDFYRHWNHYKNGFGSVAKSNEFWIGLEWMHQFTKNDPCELVVELRDESGRYGYALYSGFKVAGEEDKYRLSNEFGFTEGSVGDKMFKSRNEPFSTPDENNVKSKQNCESEHESGWWFYDCKSSNLNGPFKKDRNTGRGIFWDGWTNAATYSRMMIRRIRQPAKQDVEPFINDCKEAEKSGTNSLRIPGTSAAFPVLCEAESFNGGWLVIQQRINGTENFHRNWTDYKQGFGTVGKSSEFWLGLERIHQITKDDSYDIAIEVKNEAGKLGYALYENFKIAGESDGYRLFRELSQRDGTIYYGFELSKNARFSTPDKDNDFNMFAHCATKHKSGWWFYKGDMSNLNGPYEKDPETGRGIFWYQWTDAGTYSRMMIRRT